MRRGIRVDVDGHRTLMRCFPQGTPSQPVGHSSGLQRRRRKGFSEIRTVGWLGKVLSVDHDSRRPQLVTDANTADLAGEPLKVSQDRYDLMLVYRFQPAEVGLQLVEERCDLRLVNAVGIGPKCFQEQVEFVTQLGDARLCQARKLIHPESNPAARTMQ